MASAARDAGENGPTCLLWCIESDNLISIDVTDKCYITTYRAYLRVTCIHESLEARHRSRINNSAAEIFLDAIFHAVISSLIITFHS